ncbi:MAG: lipoprotein NlpI [Methanoregulaceae archaeon PtaU1.Bin059]|nr:MAG: lipoprotein NlpI [Methanoregulaceae archaeon PtaB.Bin152]OPY40002.1 MAG: lipoprotein NlpI [Methanoregulaceae archaeon PtaU1.Bin059]
MDHITPHTGKTVLSISHQAEYAFRVGTESAHKGDYQGALAQFDRALSSDPHFAMAWHEKGNCLDELGRCEEALSSYDTAIQLDPHHAEAWFNKGLTLKKMGREKEAYSCMNRGVDLALGR